ncbi:MAG TPA: hypothetical protein PLE22_00075 [Acidovorax sp.]|nr:hypothetical protein [Acidovorax sp.]
MTTTKPKAPHAADTDTQAAQAQKKTGQAEHAATATTTATAAGSGDAAAVVSATPSEQATAAAPAPPVHNPKRGGLYRQEGGDKPVAVHRTLHPDDPEAQKALGKE